MYVYTAFDRHFVHQRAAQYRDQLERQVAGVIDAGACPQAPTTVIDLSQGTPEILRHGRGDLARLGL